MHLNRTIPLACACLALVLFLIAPGSQAATSFWPEDSSAPVVQTAQGLPRIHSLLVAHHGEPVIEQVFRGPGLEQPVNIKSLAKTVLAALTGAALQEGILESLDRPVVDLLGARVPDDATPGVEAITLSHLLSLQAGLGRTSGRNYGRWVVSPDWVAHVLTRPFEDKPGGTMLYSTGSSHLLSVALTETSGASTLALARRLLGEPLNIRIPPWPKDPQGIYFGGNDMLMSPRALMAIGELYRNDGLHQGRRLLPEGWVATSWQVRGRSAFTGDGYGYGWFLRELAGEQAYYGRGFGGQVLYVLPALALTIVVTSDPTPPSSGSGYLRQIHSIVEQHIIPAARKADRIHEASRPPE